VTAGSPFVVGVARLRRTVGSQRRVQVAGPLPDLAVVGSAVPDGVDVAVDATLESLAGGVSVVGLVRAPWVAECRRCLGPAGGVLEVAVRELYTPAGDGADAYPIHGDQLDLALAASDAILLALPLAPLCSPQCRGLCPECGADLNREPCGGHETRDARWAALDVLRVDQDLS
jgi:uncharacterized protein